MHTHHYKDIKVKKLDGSQVEITGEIEAKELEQGYKEALKGLSARADMPGFRKGHVPEHVIVSKMGEMAILEEAAEIVLSHEYGHIVMDHKIEVIGRPEITLTKLAKGSPLEFKIVVAIFPEVKMPDYKKIAKAEMAAAGKEKVEVTEKEIADSIEQIQKHYAPKAVNDPKAPAPAAASASLPALDDAFVKTLGDFKDVADFKAKVKENMLQEKTHRAKEKTRIKVSEEIVAGMKVDLPEILVSSEIKKMWNEFEHDISRMGLKAEDYLKHIKKTREEMEKEWRKDAEKRVGLQIALNKIAAEEKLVPSEDDVQKEMAVITAQHKDVDPERVRNYVEMVLTNERAFRFLEEQK